MKEESKLLKDNPPVLLRKCSRHIGYVAVTSVRLDFRLNRRRQRSDTGTGSVYDFGRAILHFATVRQTSTRGIAEASGGHWSRF